MSEKDNGKKAGRQHYIFTRETLGMIILLVSALLLVAMLTRSLVFGSVGRALCTFMYGTFGYGSYPVLAVIVYLGVWLVSGKSAKIPARCLIAFSVCVLFLFFLFQAVSAYVVEIDMSSYGAYLSGSYMSASDGIMGYTAGGIICSIFVYPVATLISYTGAFIVFSVFTVLFGFLFYLSVRSYLFGKKVSKFQNVADSASEDNRGTAGEAVRISAQNPVPADDAAMAQDGWATYRSGDGFVNNPYDGAAYGQDGYREYVYGQENSTPQDTVTVRENAAGGQPEQPQNTPKKELTSWEILYGEKSNENYLANNRIFSGDSYFSSGKSSATDTEGYYRGLGLKSTATAVAETEKPKTSDGAVAPSYNYDKNRAASVTDTDGDAYGTDMEGAHSAAADIIADRDADLSGGRYGQDTDADDVGSYSPRDVGRFDDGLFQDDDISVRGGGNTSLPGDRYGEESYSPRDVGRFDDDLFPDEGISARGAESDRGIPSRRITEDDEDSVDGGISAGMDGIRSGAGFFGDGDDTENDENVIDEPVREPFKIHMPTKKDVADSYGDGAGKKEISEPPKPHVWAPYKAPTADLMKDTEKRSSVTAEEIERNKKAIVETLQSFKIESQVTNVVVGCRFTRYDVSLSDKTLVKSAAKRSEEIQMALKKQSINVYINFRIDKLSVEVPNDEAGTVSLKTVMNSDAFRQAYLKKNSLVFGLGQSIEGDYVCPDLTKMPHLLVAGATNTGKSVCLNSMLISFMYNYSPKELRLILIDPKQVEFVPYSHMPHLLIDEILYDVTKVKKALDWAIAEMERRYELFRQVNVSGHVVRNITDYNDSVGVDEKLCRIVIVLDEFGDLMLQSKKDIEGRIMRLVAKSRACGIHLVLATQRPSVDVITGVIKSNLPARIGLQTSSYRDSMTIFDQGGAEKLLGKGDMYFKRPDKTEFQRLQGCYVDNEDIESILKYIKDNNETFFDDGAAQFIDDVTDDDRGGGRTAGQVSDDQDSRVDETFIKALKMFIETGQASVSMLQRKMSINYMKATRIVDLMTQMHYISENDGSRARKVLLTMDDFIDLYGEVDD